MSLQTKLIYLFSLIISVAQAQEKPREFSPYSRFGIGDLADPNLSSVSQLGGAGAAFCDRNLLNAANPASLGFLKNTAFEGGVSIKNTGLKESGQSKSFFGGGLDYLALGLPLQNQINDVLERVNRKWHVGTMIVLKPYSFVGYSVAQRGNASDIGNYQINYTGNGGTYAFKWNTAVAYQNLSVGVGLQYLFGKMSYQRVSSLVDSAYSLRPITYSSIFADDISMHGFNWNFGIQYKINLKKPEEGENESSKFLTLGVYGNGNHDFTTTANQLYRRILTNSGTSAAADTVKNLSGVDGIGTLPKEIHFGVYYNDKYKFQVGAQYSMVGWSNYKNAAKPETLKNASEFALGVGYCPNIESFDNFFERVTYRLGFRTGTDPRSFNDQQLKFYAFNVGASLPFIFQRKVSFINLGLEFGKMGISSGLDTHYTQVKLGFTLNDDDWFLRKKYD